MKYLDLFVKPLGIAAILAGSLAAQDVTHETLVNPPADSWPMYHGDYSGKRHSPLTQITPENVGNLSLAWAFQTGASTSIKASPLVVDGVIYFSVPDIVWAVDARSGRELWRYQYPENKGFHIGSRGVSMYKDWLFFVTPDSHLISLNAKDGSLRWDVEVADAKRGYWMTLSPLIVGNHVMVGPSGDFDNLTGFLKAIDPETGETQWRWDSTPPAGTPGGTTGGMMWMSGTYDPEANLVYWGTGNPTPVLNGRVRPGDNLYTGSIVALNPDTGKLAWAFQALAARHPRLGRGGSAGAGRCGVQRTAAQVAVAGIAQRIFLRVGSFDGREFADQAVRSGELGDRPRCQGATDSESG